MNDDETTLNTNSRTDHSDAFADPINPEIPRRQFDRKILESYDADHARIRSISNRQTGIEALLTGVQKDLRRLEEQQSCMLVQFEKTAESIGDISKQFAVHTQMEEFQWLTVNKANLTLAEVGASLHEHLESAGRVNTRIDWIEKLMWALWGVVGAAGAMLVPMALKGMGL
jgi:hypothetical protein